MVKATSLGNIEITPNAISTLVNRVALQTYGVVDMAVPSRKDQLAATLTRDPNRGVSVIFHDEDSLSITLYIVVNYGTNIASIANNLIKAVRYHVESRTSLQVRQVNIHVQGLRINAAQHKK